MSPSRTSTRRDGRTCPSCSATQIVLPPTDTQVRAPLQFTLNSCRPDTETSGTGSGLCDPPGVTRIRIIAATDRATEIEHGEGVQLVTEQWLEAEVLGADAITDVDGASRVVDFADKAHEQFR